jgi:hypothetical protein
VSDNPAVGPVSVRTFDGARMNTAAHGKTRSGDYRVIRVDDDGYVLLTRPDDAELAALRAWQHRAKRHLMDWRAHRVRLLVSQPASMDDAERDRLAALDDLIDGP